MWPTCNGPVGFADTNSTFTFNPAPMSERPKSAPAATATGITFCHNSGDRRRFKKPGPATSADMMRSSLINNSANPSAIARGFARAGFAKTIAAFVAISPCNASRGGSTATLAKFKSAGNVPAVCMVSSEVRTRVLISANRFIDLSKIDCGRFSTWPRQVPAWSSLNRFSA